MKSEVGIKRPKTGGRAKGTPNKATKELKDAILHALDGVGGVEYLQGLALSHPPAFAGLLGKVLPMTVQGPNPDGSFTVVAPWLKQAIQARN